MCAVFVPKHVCAGCSARTKIINLPFEGVNILLLKFMEFRAILYSCVHAHNIN